MAEAARSTLERAAPGHVATVRAAVFDRLDPGRIRVFGEVCEIVLAGLSDPEASPAELPWRR